MARRNGWHRVGTRRRPRYVDADGKDLADESELERIRGLVIPPAWRDVWIARSPRAKLQATGVDKAGRTQYLYHPEFRRRREELKYEKLIRFAEHLPELRQAMAEHIELPGFPEERVAAIAVRLINLAWFRVGSDRYVRSHRTFGITTLRKSHVAIRGSRITFSYRGKHGIAVRSAIVDRELSAAVRELRELSGPRLFRFENGDGLCDLGAARLNAYIRAYLGAEFTAKDFRTWGGTLVAAVALAESPAAESDRDAKRRIAAVMRLVGEKLGNTPAVARSSYVSPAVIEQYLEGRTIADFRPRHLRVVSARDTGLDPEEQATLSLLRSWRIRSARAAA
jgi:DNA topoisomerase-1